MMRMLLLMGAVAALGACAVQPPAPDAPGEPEVAAALREALSLGAARAAERLGQPDGYWSDRRLRIPLPEMLGRASRYLRAAGHARAVADFERALNRAAEEAAPQAAAPFADAARELGFADARAILLGPADAATQALREAARERLLAAHRPAIAQATVRLGVTRRYKALVDRAGPLAEFLLKDARDLDAYVAGCALDGLFLALAEEEARIRQDPAAHGSPTLARVFDSAAGVAAAPP